MDQQKRIVAKVGLTEKEAIFLFLYSRKNLFIILFICAYFIYLSFLYFALGLPLLLNIQACAVMLMFTVPIVLLSLAFIIRKEYRRNSKLREETVITFISKDAPHTRSEDKSNNYVDWKHVYAVKELKKNFIFYFSPFSATMIPKRCFKSEEEIAIIREMISSSVDSDKVKLKE